MLLSKTYWHQRDKREGFSCRDLWATSLTLFFSPQVTLTYLVMETTAQCSISTISAGLEPPVRDVDNPLFLYLGIPVGYWDGQHPHFWTFLEGEIRCTVLHLAVNKMRFRNKADMLEISDIHHSYVTNKMTTKKITVCNHHHHPAPTSLPPQCFSWPILMCCDCRLLTFVC